jgi:NADPH2 dehydrogenase
MSPSGIPVPVKDRRMETPDAMSAAEIGDWKHWFLDSARRASLAGFDILELHSAHGYGLNQWLSPLTNRREDAYGRDAEGRSRLLLELVSEIRAAHPGLLVSVRMPGQDFLDGGMTSAEAIEVARSLEGAGVDLVDVSSGIGGWRRPRDREGEGYLVAEAHAIQASVRAPVIGVGGIRTGAYVDRALDEGRFSLAAIGRAILEDPAGWGKAQLEAAMSEAG